MKKKLLANINKIANNINISSKWSNSGQVFGHLQGAKDYYIYEFFCYVSFVRDLKMNGNSVIFNNHGKKRIIFLRELLIKKMVGQNFKS